MKLLSSTPASPPSGRPEICNPLDYKFPVAPLLALLLAALALGSAGLSFAAETPAPANAAQGEPCACCREEKQPAPKDACCAEKPAGKKDDACCTPSETENRESEVQAFTQESLYQSEATFTDDTGKAFALGSLRGRPVVLDLFFASCGYACPLTVTDLLALQDRLPAELRRQTVFVLVSFDVARDTTEVLAKYRTQRGLDGQWILLRGNDDSVRELAALLGVKFKQEADGAFSHSNLFTVLNREGEIVHQRLGLKGGLDEAAAALARTIQ